MPGLARRQRRHGGSHRRHIRSGAPAVLAGGAGASLAVAASRPPDQCGLPAGADGHRRATRMAGLTPVLGAWLQRGEFFGVRGQGAGSTHETVQRALNRRRAA